MKKTLILLSLMTLSTTSSGHKLMTELASESDTFIGFGFALDDDSIVLQEKVFKLNKGQIYREYVKSNRERTMLNYIIKEPRINNQQSDTKPLTPFSRNNWYSHTELTSNLADSEDSDVDGDGHHGDGDFDPRHLIRARTVAMKYCNDLANENPELYDELIPYFISPTGFVIESIIDGVEVATIADDHGDYTSADDISFKCAYVIE